MGNWKSSDILKVTFKFKPGVHRIFVYGGEGCCDGKKNIKYNGRFFEKLKEGDKLEEFYEGDDGE